MPRYRNYGSDDDDFSETDISLRGPKGRTSFRQRSVSRHRRSPELRETTFLSPVLTGARMHRSASTGARRSRDREGQPQVVIMNEMQQSNKPRRVQQRIYEGHDSEEDHVLPRRVGRDDASPRQRDFDLVVGQHVLERNDIRQDMEIMKQQQEIDRLERELERHRELRDTRDSRESRMLKDEEEWYEEEISERLRRLERFERRNRSDAERRQLEQKMKIKQLEEAERKAEEEKGLKARLREEKLKELQKMKEEEDERERLKKEIIEEEMRKKIEEEKKKQKEMAMKAAAVEEWKLEQERARLKAKEDGEKRDKEFRERLKVEFGYSEEEIEAFLNKKKKEDKGKDKDKGTEAAWVKVHRKHLLPETLIAYSLPWEWDERDSNYIIIQRWITEDVQEQLFAHTRRLRENKVLTQTSSSTTELRVKDRDKDKMFLVRKKSPRRKSWLFT